MALYSADLSKLATKVTKQIETERKPKRKMSDAQKANLEKGQKALQVKRQKGKVAEVEMEVDEEEEVEVAQPVKKVRKRVKKPAPVKVEEEVVEEEEEEVVEEPKKKVVRKRKVEKVEEPVEEVVKVEEPKKKVVRKRKVEKEPTPEPVVDVAEPVKKRQRKPRDPAVPPAWFEKYIQGVKKEEAMVREEKVPAKKVKQEAQETAKERWDDGLTRDRVANEVDNHMNRMYSMIFNKR